jgi:hypothetical protein
VKKKEIGFGCNWPMNPSIPCGSRIESAESAVSGTNPAQIVAHLPAFSASLFLPSSVCQDPSLVDVQDDNNIQMINPCPHFIKEKKAPIPKGTVIEETKKKKRENQSPKSEIILLVLVLVLPPPSFFHCVCCC